MSDAPLPSSFDADSDFYEENRWQKFSRRLKQEPLIPLGCALTSWALWSASRSMRKGDPVKTNQMFRYRLYAQSFTLVAMVGGSVYYNADRLKRSEFTKLKKKQEAQEKREKWIRELEARDTEDREWRDKMGRVKDMQKEEMERQAVEELQAKKVAAGAADDGRGIIAAVREKNNAAKAREKTLEEVEMEMASAGKRARVEDAVVEEQPQEVRKSIIGESEQGGLLGINHLKGFWNSRSATAESESGDAVSGKEKTGEEDASSGK